MTSREPVVPGKEASESWDFFIAHSHRDRAKANALHALLTSGKARVFLDHRGLRAGSPWDSGLKRALTRSRISVILVSRHSEKSWYQQEEIAIAIRLARSPASAHQVVPILLSGTRVRDVPYGLNRLQLLREDDGLEQVVRTLIQRLREGGRRPGTVRLARSVGILDEVWAEASSVLQDRPTRKAAAFRFRFSHEGSDLVSRDRGREQKRIKRSEFRRRLSPSENEYVETLERSMEMNQALWKDAYPGRSISKASRARVTGAVTAMAEDLEGVLRMLERAGFWLDDHYVAVRDILDQARAAGRR